MSILIVFVFLYISLIGATSIFTETDRINQLLQEFETSRKADSIRLQELVHILNFFMNLALNRF